MGRLFNGSTDVLRPTASGTAYGDNADEITLACWVKPTVLSGRVMSYFGSVFGDQAWLATLGDAGAGTIRGAIVNSNGGFEIADSATSTITPGVWQHICMRRRRNITTDGLEVFLNGSRVANVTTQNFPINNISSQSPGLMGPSTQDSANFLAGIAAEFAVWSIALTDLEITTLASGQRANAVHAASLLGHWNVDGTASPEPDSSGFGNNAVVTGTTPDEDPPLLRVIPMIAIQSSVSW